MIDNKVKVKVFEVTEPTVLFVLESVLIKFSIIKSGVIVLLGADSLSSLLKAAESLKKFWQ